MVHSPGLNNREWIETLKTWLLNQKAKDHSPGLNNREWIETRFRSAIDQPSKHSPGLNNREWIETGLFFARHK